MPAVRREPLMVIGREKIEACENERADKKEDTADLRANGYRATRLYRATGHRGRNCPGRSAAGEKSWAAGKKVAVRMSKNRKVGLMRDPDTKARIFRIEWCGYQQGAGQFSDYRVSSMKPV
jgi:hypothetical protein